MVQDFGVEHLVRRDTHAGGGGAEVYVLLQAEPAEKAVHEPLKAPLSTLPRPLHEEARGFDLVALQRIARLRGDENKQGLRAQGAQAARRLQTVNPVHHYVEKTISKPPDAAASSSSSPLRKPDASMVSSCCAA